MRLPSVSKSSGSRGAMRPERERDGGGAAAKRSSTMSTGIGVPVIARTRTTRPSPLPAARTGGQAFAPHGRSGTVARGMMVCSISKRI